MKKVLLLGAMLSLLGANEYQISEETFSYIEVGAYLSSATKGGRAAPMVSGGVRMEKEFSAVDIGGSFAYFSYGKEGSIWGLYLPKIQFLEFSNPVNHGTVYYGGGVALAFVGNGTIDQKFFGMTVEGTVGYEWARNMDFKKRVCFEVFQPFLPFYKKQAWYYPALGLSFGLSF